MGEHIHIPLLDREFTFTENDFNYLSRLASAHAGISIDSSKQELVYGRLTRRLRTLKLKSFAQYCRQLKAGDEQELTHFLNAITTNETSFFRENHHFEFLARELLPVLIRKKGDEKRPRLRLWSAGCSSGEEPCSIAIVLRETIPDIDRWDARILATDLDSNTLDIACRGIYAWRKIGDISPARRDRWLKLGKDTNDTAEVRENIKRLITYRQLNLMEAWPMRGSFDAIFCRNVAIYFARSSRIALLNRFADLLHKNGYLFVGHAESLFGLTDRFRLVEQGIYQKVS